MPQLASVGPGYAGVQNNFLSGGREGERVSAIPYNRQSSNVSELEALGQCIPPPRHVLAVSRSGSVSGSTPKFNLLFTGPLPTFLENLMQICS